MVRTVGLLIGVMAALSFGAITAAGSVGEPAPSRATPDPVPRGNGAVTPMTMAVCASGGDAGQGCEDVYMYNAEDGTCVTNLGRPCREAQADAALRRWLTSEDGSRARAGDSQLLEVIDDRFLVVGLCSGGLEVEYVGAEVVSEAAGVDVVLNFVDHAKAQSIDGEEVTVRTLALQCGRDVIELTDPLDGRQVTIRMNVAPSED